MASITLGAIETIHAAGEHVTKRQARVQMYVLSNKNVLKKL